MDMDQVRVSLGEAVSPLRIALFQFCCQKDCLEVRALAVCLCPPFENKLQKT